MLRLVLFLAGILAAAMGLDWLANRPGTMTMNWQGHVIETSVFRFLLVLTALVALCTFAWGAIRRLWRSPAAIGQIVTRRRERKGIDALTRGMIAIGSGDKALALGAAVQARKSLPNEPLTHLLRAQAAQLQGDSATARRIYEGMLSTPDTEQLGLRELYLEAQKVGEDEAAIQFADRALKLNPKLKWPAQSLFDLQYKRKDWEGALDTLAQAKKHGHIERALADRRRAVLLTAQAQACEEDKPDQALTLAAEAHGLAPDLIPAAAIAGRVHAARGQTPKAAKIIQRTWKIAQHPDLATAYAYARAGDSPSDRLTRIRQLAAMAPGSSEGPIAIATIAIESRDWEAAHAALEPLAEKGLTHRVCMLMARIEGEGFKNAGRVREWLARAAHAERDPVWTADGVVAAQWAPVSPVTGALDAFAWRVPVSALETPEAALISQRIDDLIQLGATPSLQHSGRGEPTTVEIVPPTRREPAGKTVEAKTAEAKKVEDWLHDDDDTPPRSSSPATAKANGSSATARPVGAVAASTFNGRPDDPGTEPLDATTAKTQLERYRLVGAKN
jgi:HemY protein